MAAPRVAVAASGGRDSTALLHCTVRQGRTLGIQVVALHVHHGLQPQADDWVTQVRSQARRWGADFAFQRLSGQPERGDSVEAWARRGRYQALAEMARRTGCGLVMLAQHRRDQAETFLLQALRGAGAAGLAAMPALATRDGLVWARPWLDLPREAVGAYVQRHRLRHVDDSSNLDTRFARNRLRREVWPHLVEAFADTEPTLAAAARRAQQAAALEAEVAALDLPGVSRGAALDRDTWLALPPARRHNVLRTWLGGLPTGVVPDSLVQRLLQELPQQRSGRWPAPGGELRLYRGRLCLGGEAAPMPAPGVPPAATPGLDLSRPGLWPLPEWGGRFRVLPCGSGGVAPALLSGLQARPRTGGERFRFTARATPRCLKKQFQAHGVPAWDRVGPLLYLPSGDLLFVPGLGLDAGWHAPPGAPQLQLRWEPEALQAAAGGGLGRG